MFGTPRKGVEMLVIRTVERPKRNLCGRPSVDAPPVPVGLRFQDECHDCPQGQPRDRLSLCQAGPAGRPQAHVQATGQPRHEVARYPHGDQSRRRRRSAGCTCLRQLHRDLLVRPVHHGTAVRKQDRLDHFGLSNPDFPIEEYARTYPFSYSSDEIPDLGRTTERHFPDPDHKVDEWAKQFIRTDGPTETQECWSR